MSGNASTRNTNAQGQEDIEMTEEICAVIIDDGSAAQDMAKVHSGVKKKRNAAHQQYDSMRAWVFLLLGLSRD